MVPAHFCALRHINYQRYLLRDERSIETRRVSPRKADVETRAAAVGNREDYREQQALQVVMLRNNRVGEELCVDYSMIY